SRSLSVVRRSGDRLVSCTPSARLVITSQSGSDNFICFFLCFDIDRGVNGETTLSYARRVFVLELLSDVFHRIIKRTGFWLRLVVSSVGQLNWLCFSSVCFGLRGISILGHQFEHEVAS